MIDKKQQLRKEYIAKRLAVDFEVAENFSKSVAQKLLDIIPAGAKVAGYVAIRGEIDIMPALTELLKRCNEICLPVVEVGDKILKFLKFSPDITLVTGKFGVLCPPANSPIINPDIVLVPLVAFDANGNRIGYGGGYYDATIRSLRLQNKTVRIIGVAYSMQQLENIPVEEQDEQLDMVITENNLTICNL